MNFSQIFDPSCKQSLKVLFEKRVSSYTEAYDVFKNEILPELDRQIQAYYEENKNKQLGIFRKYFDLLDFLENNKLDIKMFKYQLDNEEERDLFYKKYVDVVLFDPMDEPRIITNVPPISKIRIFKGKWFEQRARFWDLQNNFLKFSMLAKYEKQENLSSQGEKFKFKIFEHSPRSIGELMIMQDDDIYCFSGEKMNDPVISELYECYRQEIEIMKSMFQEHEQVLLGIRKIRDDEIEKEQLQENENEKPSANDYGGIGFEHRIMERIMEHYPECNDEEKALEIFKERLKRYKRCNENKNEKEKSKNL